MSTKIRFNNFKAFGPTMQSYTKKPITLIYGPNSVGKSSFLHSQLLLAYLRTYTDRFDINVTSFAGDEIDFGGFENYIHKHDTTKNISFEIVFNDEDDLNRLLTPKYSEIMELKKNGFFDREITIEDIEAKLESEYEESGIKLKHLIGYASFYMEKHREESYKDNVEFVDLLDEIKNDCFKLALYEFYQNNENESLSAEQVDLFVQLFDTQLNKLQNNCDDLLIKAIFLTGHDESKHIVSRLKFYKYLLNIHTIQFNVELNSNANVICSIDEVKMFEIQNISHFFNKTEYPVINEEHEALQEYKMITEKQRPRKVFKDSIVHYNDSDFSLNNLIWQFFYLTKSVNQYFGPLRHYPERSEIFFIEDIEEKKDSLFMEFSTLMVRSFKNFVLFSILVIGTLAFHRIFMSQKSFFDFGIEPTESLISLIYILVIISGFFGLASKNEHIKETINAIITKKQYQLLRNNVISSYDAWQLLSKSSETIKKINEWLGDISKLKSNYSIKVVKKPITYLGIIGRRMGAYEPSFKGNKITKSIVNLWDYFERKLNIRQRYESQLVFTDIAKNTEVTPRDMGLGISQILPILISTFSSKESTLYLEQPELHLHPAVQMELADEFIRSANEQRNEFMIETHSEHLLLRIMRRMRQTANGTLEDQSLRLTPDDVCLLYVDNNGHTTYIKELELDCDGTLIDPWPNGFFEEGHRERFDA